MLFYLYKQEDNVLVSLNETVTTTGAGRLLNMTNALLKKFVLFLKTSQAFLRIANILEDCFS